VTEHRREPAPTTTPAAAEGTGSSRARPVDTARSGRRAHHTPRSRGRPSRWTGAVATATPTG